MSLMGLSLCMGCRGTLSVLRLTTIPNYTLDTHTKPQGFRVGIIDAVVMYSTILIYGL